MNPAALAASRTGQCRACCGSIGRVPSRRGLRPDPGRLEFGNSWTSTLLRQFVTQVKLPAEFSVPGAPVNFGHFGYSQTGRERFAFGLPSVAVNPDGALPCS